jgi:tripartite-type tricarboxylate transporter receptor subunit TctC
MSYGPGRIALAVLASTAALFALGAAAQEARFPAKPIRFVVPYAPGGTTDLVARVVGEGVGQKLGQPVVIDNKPGAGGNLGMDAVAKAAPDGYTIGFGAISTNALNPHVYKAMAFDPRKDFTPISMLGHSTIVLTVAPALPVKNVAEFIAHAKKNPGLTYGTAGAGTSMHLAAAMFGEMTGIAGYEVDPWFGVYGPAGMPRAVVQALNAAFVEALAQPQVRDRLLQAGFSPGGSTPEALGSLSASEYERLGRVARNAKMAVD